MPFDERLAQRIRKLLAMRKSVSEKKMFGGICFLVNGSMCCGVIRNDFCARVGPLRYEEALKQAHTRPMDFTGRPLKGFVSVAPTGLKTEASLKRWLSWAAEFAAAEATKKKRAIRRPATSNEVSRRTPLRRYR